MSEPHHDVLQEFARTAGLHPGRPALVHDGRTVTYAELAAWVRAIARRLGPGPGAVGVPASRTPGTVAALLGTLAAGGAYVPVDPAHPRARRQAMLAAAGCRTLVASGPDAWAPDGVRVIEPPDHGDPDGDFHDSRGSDDSGDPGDDLASELPVVAGDAPAYVLFTSGSTGAPKPVVTPRRAISVVTGALRELFGITPADRVLQFASLNWDTCLEEILPALTGGAALVFHDDAHSGSFRRMLRAVADERISVLDLPTAFWHELVRHLADEGAALPPRVRLVIIGGEAVSPSRLADWRALDTGGVRLLNTYGCTETTLVTHAIDLHGPMTDVAAGDRASAAGERVPIGWALAHVEQRVSAEGELLVGGPGLALGYLGLPEATAARFVAPETGGGRFFRTGDRVTVTGGGALVHEGRLDHELKIRGIRVDPAEVEAHIAGHPGVGAVAVAGVTVADHITLAAYVVPRPQPGRDAQDPQSGRDAEHTKPGRDAQDPKTIRDAEGGLAAEVREYLRERVPGHLVPSRITVVPELAYTTSGKVDRAGSHRRYTTN
ncbi:amino acid adenylation domain-containing protein [Nonomuraea sp. NPDC001636]|uniref:amino acid adenylation domain-containing protein n=1 Tax=Nonomuraea sp. NPDC001636 TaxID=3154391 RepID=UPI0033223C71